MNALGYLRVMVTVEDIDDTLARLARRGAELVGEVVRYEDAYRLCYIRRHRFRPGTSSERSATAIFTRAFRRGLESA